MNKDIDVSSLKIDLYSDKSVRDFTADVAQKDGRMWLSNVSAEIAAEAAALAVKALRKSGLEDADMKNAEHFIEVLRKFFLKTVDQELQSRAEWDKEVAEGKSQAYIEGGVFAACSEIDEVLYGMIKLIDMIESVSDKLAPEACADSIGRSAMECVKLQRYHYSTLITGDVNSMAMRREPELAIADCTERYEALYKKLQEKIK
mgnify:CR=1 FL=1